MLPDLHADPFGESRPMQFERRLQLLGAQFRFDSNDRRLMQLVEAAYGGLPRHRLAPTLPQYHVRLLTPPAATRQRRSAPPPLRMLSGGSLLAGATPASSFVAISARGHGAVVVVAPEMLRHEYHTRYELLEFAVFTLAARSQGLAALHGACIGHGGRGLLLLGASGSGKSTVALHAAIQGLDFLAEDSVFVVPHTLEATGIANYLHVRADSLRWLKGTPAETAIRASPVIRRRSGVKKFEVDLRRGTHRLAATAQKLKAVVFLSAEPAATRPLLQPLSAAQLGKRLRQEQSYAVNQPPWPSFADNIQQLDAFELRRGRHPNEAVAVLRDLMQRH